MYVMCVCVSFCQALGLDGYPGIDDVVVSAFAKFKRLSKKPRVSGMSPQL